MCGIVVDVAGVPTTIIIRHIVVVTPPTPEEKKAGYNSRVQLSSGIWFALTEPESEIRAKIIQEYKGNS